MTLIKKFVKGYCVVCGKVLEDPVSLESGMGPHCRKMANLLLAKQLDSSLGLPETIGKVFTLSQTTEQDATIQERLCALQDAFMQGTDHRAAVTEAASLLNRVRDSTARLLCELIAAAGYGRYLAYIQNAVASGADNILDVENVSGVPMVCFYGVRCKSAHLQMKQAGIRYAYHDRRKGHAGCYQTPVAMVDKIIALVEAGWPFTKDLDNQILAVREKIAAIPAPAVEQPEVQSSKFQDYILVDNDRVVFTTPCYNEQGIAKIKEIPTRRYHPKESSPTGKPAWSFNSVWITSVAKIAKQWWNLEE